ncbi:peptidase [Phakopsora pachyrhizi]|nr:peptidase [Phakopsora pachyrhizi]
MLWIPVGIFFFDRIVGIVKITGTSMQPTLNPDSSCLVEDIVIVTKFDQKLDRGDIVTFRHPSDPCLVLAKRIIGLEKDLVKVRKTNDLNLTGVIQIPSGHCWVEGDDKFHSKDSNQFGPIPMGLITGKVVMILWPIS